MTTNKRRGFTLIELLVVIAIIAILAAILFPVFAQMKEKARRIACSVHLRQIALAISQYVEDNDGGFPHFAQDWWIEGSYHSSNWAREIQPYVKSWSILRCPSALTAVHWYNEILTSYGFNRRLSTRIAGPVSLISRVRHPSDLIMVADCAYDDGPTPAEKDNPDMNMSARGDWPHGNLSFRHTGGSNVAFVDCHVAFLKRS